VDIIDQHDEMWNADATEHRLALTGGEREATHCGRRVDGRKMDLGATSFEAAAAVGARVGLELNPLGRPNGQMRRQRGTAERCIAAHGGVRAVGFVVDHARRTGVRTRSHEHDAVGPDARPPGAYRLHVLGRPVGCSGYTCIEHDEIVARSRHLVDGQADQMRPNQAMSRRRGTFHTASRTMARFILLCPSVRSTNTIGISRSLNPFLHARTLISIWKAYPLEPTAERSIASSTRLRKHLNPPVRSQTLRPVIQRA